MENPQSSYYSGSYGDTAVKISYDTVHQKLENNIFDNNSLNSKVLELQVIDSVLKFKVAITQLAMEIQLWNLVTKQNIKK